jgi:hypothetical protein
VQNLANRFPWLPDGAILDAWVKLRRQKTDKELRAARSGLLEGYGRGLPIYAKGVRLLLDGLTLFASDAREAGQEDAEVEAALRSVRRWARQTNTRQVFSCVVVKRPEG